MKVYKVYKDNKVFDNKLGRFINKDANESIDGSTFLTKLSAVAAIRRAKTRAKKYIRIYSGPYAVGAEYFQQTVQLHTEILESLDGCTITEYTLVETGQYSNEGTPIIPEPLVPLNELKEEDKIDFSNL